MLFCLEVAVLVLTVLNQLLYKRSATVRENDWIGVQCFFCLQIKKTKQDSGATWPLNREQTHYHIAGTLIDCHNIPLRCCCGVRG